MNCVRYKQMKRLFDEINNIDVDEPPRQRIRRIQAAANNFSQAILAEQNQVPTICKFNTKQGLCTKIVCFKQA